MFMLGARADHPGVRLDYANESEAASGNFEISRPVSVVAACPTKHAHVRRRHSCRPPPLTASFASLCFFQLHDEDRRRDVPTNVAVASPDSLNMKRPQLLIKRPCSSTARINLIVTLLARCGCSTLLYLSYRKVFVFGTPSTENENKIKINGRKEMGEQYTGSAPRLSSSCISEHAAPEALHTSFSVKPE